MTEGGGSNRSCSSGAVYVVVALLPVLPIQKNARIVAHQRILQDTTRVTNYIDVEDWEAGQHSRNEQDTNTGEQLQALIAPDHTEE